MALELVILFHQPGLLLPGEISCIFLPDPHLLRLPSPPPDPRSAAPGALHAELALSLGGILRGEEALAPRQRRMEGRPSARSVVQKKHGIDLDATNGDRFTYIAMI